MTHDRSRRAASATLVCLDAFAYAVAVAAVATLGALVVGVATGGGLVRAKLSLFLAGFGLMGYATARLWPTSPGESRQDPVGTAGASRLQALVDRLLPGSRFPPPPDRRLAPPSKLFAGSLLVLVVSALMETVLGVG